MEYKQFRFEDISCDAATEYTLAEGELKAVVSAVAYGSAPDIKDWVVKDITLIAGGKKIMPDKSDKFFVSEDTVRRFPAAAVFMAIASDAGATLRADGDLSGLKGVFKFSWGVGDKIDAPGDCVEIKVENSRLKTNRTLKIAIRKVEPAPARFDYFAMRPDEIRQVAEMLDAQLATLVRNLKNFKQGADGEYEEIQNSIESLESERALAYMALLSK